MESSFHEPGTRHSNSTGLQVHSPDGQDLQRAQGTRHQTEPLTPCPGDPNRPLRRELLPTQLPAWGRQGGRSGGPGGSPVCAEGREPRGLHTPREDGPLDTNLPCLCRRPPGSAPLMVKSVRSAFLQTHLAPPRWGQTPLQELIHRWMEQGSPRQPQVKGKACRQVSPTERCSRPGPDPLRHSH